MPAIIFFCSYGNLYFVALNYYPDKNYLNSAEAYLELSQISVVEVFSENRWWIKVKQLHWDSTAINYQYHQYHINHS